MIQIGECYYMGPRCGDVSLLTCRWRDSESAETIHHTAVPVVGTVAWWSWCDDAPAFVQQTLRKMYETVHAADLDAPAPPRNVYTDTEDDADDEEAPPNGQHHG